ncbi:MAG: putative toxin-antitoxin system toxin component, PIN family [Candidatus Fraserbacteria bacterium RBG_16_55_9]|uniref:Putative toxin-antitoxin system toxin component, PIN family n=1 Tax=Fraserbacteria sp. (strain RBG_16_55_9) TaxID=1817864 RepID=A0A1F5URD0_FRAXR|nr:MAG: putative toxin-antitoxin system toxin component, PIN family [Candidatus Fraserbacteria bacterium RBG_16_55_9]
MRRVVLDTSVIVSGTLIDAGHPAKILDWWQNGLFALVTSEAIMEEVKEVLNDPELREEYQLTRAKVGTLLNLMRHHSILVPAELDLAVVERDPGDDKIIVAAVEGGADTIVSGDGDLLDLKAYQGIKIVTPTEFAKSLNF